MERAVENARERVQEKMQDIAKVKSSSMVNVKIFTAEEQDLYQLPFLPSFPQAQEASRQRSLASLDLFLESARAQLQGLMATQDTPPSSLSPDSDPPQQ